MKMQEFESNYQKSQQKFQFYNKKSNRLSMIRFCLFVMAIIVLFIGYFQKKDILYILSLLYIFLFLYVVSIHLKVKKKLLYYESLTEVFHQHIQRINNQWDCFEEDGKEFLKDDMSIDLDLFGHHSLFQLINATFTYQGKKLLAQNMVEQHLDKDTILKRQEALNELSEHEEFILKIQTYGKMMKVKDEKTIYQFIHSLSNHHYHQVTSLLYVLPLFVLLTIICSFLSIGLPYSYILCELGIVLQIIVTILFFRKNAQMFEPVKKFQQSLNNYQQLFLTIQNEPFHSSLLIELQAKISQDQQAVKGIEKLSRISQAISYRQNILLLILFNGLGLYDIFVRNSYIHWMNTYGMNVQQWFDALAEMELFISLYIPKMDDFNVQLPQISDTMNLSFKNLKHPLIDTDKAVGNSFKLEKNGCIITGSNMSGKTTFMRTIGINLILSYMGSYIFGENMICSCMHILTSMRVKDNVEEGISTFYGELLRIKKMIEYSQLKQPMICFIDEIFKGTNSLDRIAGAKATIEKLSLEHCIFFMTTHDFELCQAQGINVSNYHFDEYYKDDKIYFDYLIHKGQSQTTNGQFLLKQLGIL